ncbi:Predicted DNA-binding transcriptional regulator YafY, contains an HTH and WYL domains [Dyadobacter soli]|uniref:Predicted DNA-binding transcriptional regulator YafY, contains an HTH and WYL domains n=1 Tax=Dyadobacter soli TaxID=659014 RepID=A0A1G7T7H9_9BACT|nr:YafY family protein [Dyadobacter soli]SDG30974.1 Predicted DNA-binding transcriptional regulator YafY, contains an HTH and WYL domains [Dyadobacter soli]
MIDSEATRLSRLVALLTLLQTKRTLTATELAQRFAVSTRTIYRDIRTLESAGIPIVTQEGKGYTMLEGYRLPPVMFTREEAIALLTAEKLAARLTDAATARLSSAAMDKLRAALRHADRDHLESIAPYIQVMEPPSASERPNTYQQLVAAVTSHRVVNMGYQAAESGEATLREIEPIGLYLSDHWHVIAYCRLRQAFRNFRLDRISSLSVSGETFPPRPETLQQYWAEEAKRIDHEKVVIHFDPSKVPPAQGQHLHDTKHKYGWMHEQTRSDGKLEMLFLVGSLSYMATWLLPFAGSVKVIEPVSLLGHLSTLAKQAYEAFDLD